MKHVKTLNELFGFNEEKPGDKIVARVLEIIKDEKIRIKDTGGYQVEIDGKIYSFAKFYGELFSSDCQISIFDQSQRTTSGIITGNPISKYEFSNKLWKELEKMYQKQITDISSDLEELNDTRRSANKYNL